MITLIDRNYFHFDFRKEGYWGLYINAATHMFTISTNLRFVCERTITKMAVLDGKMYLNITDDEINKSTRIYFSRGNNQHGKVRQYIN